MYCGVCKRDEFDPSYGFYARYSEDGFPLLIKCSECNDYICISCYGNKYQYLAMLSNGHSLCKHCFDKMREEAIKEIMEEEGWTPSYENIDSKTHSEFCCCDECNKSLPW